MDTKQNRDGSYERGLPFHTDIKSIWCCAEERGVAGRMGTRQRRKDSFVLSGPFTMASKHMVVSVLGLSYFSLSVTNVQEGDAAPAGGSISQRYTSQYTQLPSPSSTYTRLITTRAHTNSLGMSQQQVSYHPHAASQSLGGQQWGANNGNVVYFNNIGPAYYSTYPHVQGSAAPSSVQNGGPQRPQLPVPDAHIPGFTRTGHPVQQLQPHFGGTNVQSHMGHVCNCLKNPTEQERQILHVLCNYVIERSRNTGRTGDCDLVGEEVSRKCVDLFNRNAEVAKNMFWRRAQKTASQREKRAEVKQQKARAEQPDLGQQWPANTPDYYPQMVNGNAGDFRANANTDFYSVPSDHNPKNLIQMQMQQMAYQALPSQDQLNLDMQADPQYALPAVLQFGLQMGPQPIQQNL